MTIGEPTQLLHPLNEQDCRNRFPVSNTPFTEIRMSFPVVSVPYPVQDILLLFRFSPDKLSHIHIHLSILTLVFHLRFFCLTRGDWSVEECNLGLRWRVFRQLIRTAITRLASNPGRYIDVCSSSDKKKIEHSHLQNCASPLKFKYSRGSEPGSVSPSYLIQSILMAISLVTSSSTISQLLKSCDLYVSLPMGSFRPHIAN